MRESGVPWRMAKPASSVGDVRRLRDGSGGVG